MAMVAAAAPIVVVPEAKDPILTAPLKVVSVTPVVSRAKAPVRPPNVALVPVTVTPAPRIVVPLASVPMLVMLALNVVEVVMPVVVRLNPPPVIAPNAAVVPVNTVFPSSVRAV